MEAPTSAAAPLWFQSEVANMDALRKVWTEHRLGQVLAAALDSYNRLGGVNSEAAADALGVSRRTIQRWVNNGVPASRLGDVVAMVRPPQGAFTQEAKDLINDREALRSIASNPVTADQTWGSLGWLLPHDVAIVQLRDAPVRVARIARTGRASGVLERLRRKQAVSPEEKDGLRRLSAGGDIIEILTFRNRFAASAARGEILEDVYAYRLQLPTAKLARGAGKAWLSEAPLKPLSSYRRRPRKHSRQTTAATTS